MEVIDLAKSGMDYAVSAAIKVLKEGGVVVHPTDTCYGLACDVTNESAVEKLFKVKRMPVNKPVSIFVDSFEMAEEYGVFTDSMRQIVGKYWPCSLTVIVFRNGKLPAFFNLNIDSIGIRFPDCELCLKMVKGVGAPITTTSANLSGRSEVYNVSDFFVQLNEERNNGRGFVEPDLVIDAGQQPLVKPSTIVRQREKGSMQIVRQGELKIV